MFPRRISNMPFLDIADNMYGTTNKRDFKVAPSTVVPKRGLKLPPIADFQHRDQNYLGKKGYLTETALSFPPRPLKGAVTQPKLTHLTMLKTNFKMHSDDSSRDFKTTHTPSEQKPLPICAAKIIRPKDAVVMTRLPEGKHPEPTYKTTYIKHKVAPIIKAKQSAKTAVGSSLIMDKMDRYSSSYHEQFQYRWIPRPPLSTEKEQIQRSSVSMGDNEKKMDELTMYSTAYEKPADRSFAEFKEGRFPKIKTPNVKPVYLREQGGKKQTGKKEGPSTTNQCFFPKIENRHVRPYH